MAPKDYIIFPLDLPNRDEAMCYVEQLKDHVGLFKVGLELFVSEGPSILQDIGARAGEAGVFLDLKLHDIPETVGRALAAASRFNPAYLTIHCDEGGGALKDHLAKSRGNTRILAVTLLTSLGRESIGRLGYEKQYVDDVTRLVLLRARLAKEAGCQGIVCSGREVAAARNELGPDFVIVAPGIRPAWTVVGGDDQRRVVTPAMAVRAGADFIVVGRPIRDAADPVEAAQRVAEEIASGLEDRKV